jgi:hypothetical protein
VHRFGRIIVAVLLCASASGTLALITAEQCALTESDRAGDHSCPPTCARCGCCSQAMESIGVTTDDSPEPVVELPVPPFSTVPTSVPRDILHVPKLSLA